jgi:hypothetical protein
MYIVAESCVNEHLPFLSMGNLHALCAKNIVQFQNINPDQNHYFSNVKERKVDEGLIPKIIPVSELARWMPEYKKENMLQKVNFRKISDIVYPTIQLPLIHSFGTYSESIYEINGLAIPAMLESESGTITMMRNISPLIEQHRSSEKDSFANKLLEKFNEFKNKIKNQHICFNEPSHFLELACLYNAAVKRLIH